MSISGRILVIAAGYIAALVIAFVAIYALRAIIPPTNDMRDFADAFKFVFLAGLLGLIPTGIAFYWLRYVAWLWYAVAAGALAFAVLGAFTTHALRQISAGPLEGFVTFGTLTLIGSPLLVLISLLAALMTRIRAARAMLLAAAALEVLACLNYYARLLMGRAMF